MSNVIEVRNISKRYKLRDAQTKYKNFTEIASHLIRLPYNYMRQIMHGERPGLKNETFWALDDVSFDLEQGDVLGILGRNGSGKSTLLKILSRVTSPTRGRIEILGRIGSLLEVGTGFHPELTGRENIFLNGIIIGMNRNEVKSKFDEIVEFSGVSKFLDMPVKHYSSGMFMRLAFSVAVHLEPEILIIDEVLAVGDLDFQEKCMKKMKSFRDAGHSILFVSHNIQAVQNLTNKALLLNNGKQVDFGDTQDVIYNYINNYSHESSTCSEDNSLKSPFKVMNFTAEPYKCDKFCSGQKMQFSFDYEFNREVDKPKIAFAINTKDEYNSCGLLADAKKLGVEKLPPRGKITCISDNLFFTEGNCIVQLAVLENDNPVFLNKNIAHMYNSRNSDIIYAPRDWFDYCVKSEWKLEQ